MKRRKITENKMYPLGLLYTMFEKIQEKFKIEEDEEVYNRLIEIFGDLCRLHPMPEKTRPIFDCLGYEIIIKFIIGSHKSFKETKVAWDYFGRLYESLHHLPKPELHGKTKKKVQGINLTPEYIVQYINKNTIEESKKIAKKEERPLFVLDPSCGTGRFLLDALNRDCGGYKQVVCGVEKDLWLYRTCLINCTIYHRFGIWKVLCADALLNDCIGLFERSDIINQWNVPHWKKLLMKPEAKKIFQERQTKLGEKKYGKHEKTKTEICN